MHRLHILFLTMILILHCSCGHKADPKTGFKEKPKEEKMDENGEKFEKLDISELNMKLLKADNNLSPEDIMKLYYPNEVEAGEGNEQIQISQSEISENEIKVTLIHENMMDDSINGEKYVLRLKKVGLKWIASSLKKNWKCWEGRGHTTWGISNCK